MHNITLIEGDGIGPEITKSLRNVIDHAGVDINWEIFKAGEGYYKEHGELISDDVFKSLEKNKVGIKGPITTPIGTGFRSINVFLRKKYDLFANVRPVKSIGNIKSKYDNIDITIFRENTEDLYAGIEKKISDDEMHSIKVKIRKGSTRIAKKTFKNAKENIKITIFRENTEDLYDSIKKKISDDEMHSIKVITRKGSTRIAKKAFEYAKDNNIDKVTVVTKANIMKLTDGLFLEVARDVAKEYPNIELEEILVDNMGMQLVMYPEKYNIILTENLYGDILSDLCSGFVGGLGLIPGANIGEDISIFEAVHGSAPDIAGKNIANPTAIILSGCLMLDYIDRKSTRLNSSHVSISY